MSHRTVSFEEERQQACQSKPQQMTGSSPRCGQFYVANYKEQTQPKSWCTTKRAAGTVTKFGTSCQPPSTHLAPLASPGYTLGRRRVNREQDPTLQVPKSVIENIAIQTMGGHRKALVTREFLYVPGPLPLSPVLRFPGNSQCDTRAQAPKQKDQQPHSSKPSPQCGTSGTSPRLEPNSSRPAAHNPSGIYNHQVVFTSSTVPSPQYSYKFHDGLGRAGAPQYRALVSRGRKNVTSHGPIVVLRKTSVSSW